MDGFGWLLDKRCRLMKTYGWTADYVRFEVTGAEGWIYYNWATENEASVWGSGVVNKTPSYVKQEWLKLMKAHNGRK